MRVITGKYKGRKLNAPPNYDIRPTADRVKEALFSILTNEVYGSRVLDLFAGTGGLGIEALSRGARYCLFADNSRASLSIVRENLARCKVDEKIRTAAGDYRQVLMNLAGRIESGHEEKFDIILLDPPYNGDLLDDAFRLIGDGDLLSDDGVIAAEHGRREVLPDAMYGFAREKERRYGAVVLSIFRKRRRDASGPLSEDD